MTSFLIKISRCFHIWWMRTWKRRSSNQSGSRKQISMCGTWQIQHCTRTETRRRMVSVRFVEENWKESLMEIIHNPLCPDAICFITMILILVNIDQVIWFDKYDTEEITNKIRHMLLLSDLNLKYFITIKQFFYREWSGKFIYLILVANVTFTLAVEKYKSWDFCCN